MSKVIQLCHRSIIRHLTGDGELAEKYKYMALEEREKKRSISSIGDMISKETQAKLYKLAKSSERS